MSESILSSQSHKLFESKSSKIFSSQIQNHDLVESSQSGVTRTVDLL